MKSTRTENESSINSFLRSPNALQEIRKRLTRTSKYRILNHFNNSNLFDMGLEQGNLQNMTIVLKELHRQDGQGV